MTVDYDAPRNPPEEEPAINVLEMARTRGVSDSRSEPIDESENDESVDLPEVDLSESGLIVHVLPQQTDEFLCESCFLVCHRSQLAEGSDGQHTCLSCHA